MSATLAHIWRHPLKAIGREALDKVVLTPGQWLPHDRRWAVIHERSKPDNGWLPKANFLRGVAGPALMAATAQLDDAGTLLTLDHPEAGQITFEPDNSEEIPRLLEWLSRVWPSDLPSPTGIYSADDVRMTDVPDPWLSVNNRSTHRAVEQRVGKELSIHRWRGNLWIDGLAPWQEFEWIDKTIRIGPTTLAIRQRITRCKATMANPDTGRRDADTLAALRTWDHQDFGVYAEVIEGGEISTGHTVTVPA